MQKTIFYTPVISHAMHYIARIILFSMGWTYQANPQVVRKYVVIAAPHTSNWDFFFTLLLAFALKLKVYAMGKKSLTEGPLGPVMLWLGIIPIDRSRSNNVVAQTIETFNQQDDLVMVIPRQEHEIRFSTGKQAFTISPMEPVFRLPSALLTIKENAEELVLLSPPPEILKKTWWKSGLITRIPQVNIQKNRLIIDALLNSKPIIPDESNDDTFTGH